MKEKFLDYDKDWKDIKDSLDFLVSDDGNDCRDAAIRTITTLA